MKKSSVLLITPPQGVDTGTVHKPKFQTHPLGLLYIAAVLRQDGFPVALCDANSFGFSLDYIMDYVRKIQPRIVGLTAMTILAPAAYCIAKEIKEMDPSIMILLGGPHGTALPEEALRRGCIDIVVLGEGEYATREVCNCVAAGSTDFSRIKGIVYQRNGAIMRTASREPIMEIDSLPYPAYDTLAHFHDYNPPPHWGKKGRFASVITSRGCPYGCIFCSVTRAWGRHYRYRSAENVLGELRLLCNQYGVRYISFRDSTMTLVKGRVIELCQQMASADLNIRWNCNSRVNEIDEELLACMKKAGCEAIQFGIECGNSEMLKRFKNFDKARVAQAIEITQKYGIKAHGYFMFGLPGETEETINQTIEFAKSLPLFSAGFTTVTPFPGSELWDYALSHDLVLTQDWSQYDLKGVSVVRYPQLDSRDILREQKRAFRSFYLRPKIVIQHLATLKNMHDVVNYVREAFANFR